MHTRPPPVPIGAAEEEPREGELQLDVRLFRSIGALVDHRVALAELDGAPVGELRVVQQVVVPAPAHDAGDQRRRAVQVELERGEEALVTFGPQRVAVGVAERLEPRAGLGVKAHLLRPARTQQLHLVGQLVLDRRDPLDLFAGELPLRFRFQHGPGDVDPTVGLEERREVRDAAAGDEQVEVVVGPVAE